MKSIYSIICGILYDLSMIAYCAATATLINSLFFLSFIDSYLVNPSRNSYLYYLNISITSQISVSIFRLNIYFNLYKKIKPLFIPDIKVSPRRKLPVQVYPVKPILFNQFDRRIGERFSVDIIRNCRMESLIITTS